MAKPIKTAPARSSASAAQTAAAVESAAAATASTESAGETQTATTGSADRAITLDNIEQRLSSLLQTEDNDGPAAESGEENGESQAETTSTEGNEPSPKEEEAGQETAPGETATAEGQPGAEGEGAENGQTEQGETETPEWARKRIDKLTAQKYELKEELEGLRAQVGELQSKLDAPNATAAPVRNGSPLDGIKSETELQAKEQEAETLLDWVDDQMVALRRNPDQVARTLRDNKVDLKDAEGNEDFSRESMEAFLLQTRRNLDKTVRVFIPQRRQHLQAAQHFEAVAGKEFPFISDRKSPEHAVAQEVIAHFPGIKSRPDWKIIVGVHTLGLMALRERQGKAKAKANGKTEVAPKIAPRVATAAAIPSRADPRKVQVEQARNKMLKTGDPTDYIKSSLGLVNTYSS